MPRSFLMVLSVAFAWIVLSVTSAAARLPDDGLVGDWTDPGGSMIRIAPCGPNLCATLVAIRANAPSQFDIHNPDASRRNQRLCGLLIGRDFRRTSPTHAEDGTLYDPKTGKTYHGEMTVSGDHLELRGYVGIKLFGRSETWARAEHAPSPCPA